MKLKLFTASKATTFFNSHLFMHSAFLFIHKAKKQQQKIISINKSALKNEKAFEALLPNKIQQKTVKSRFTHFFPPSYSSLSTKTRVN
jgi:hypothetical protein